MPEPTPPRTCALIASPAAMPGVSAMLSACRPPIVPPIVGTVLADRPDECARAIASLHESTAFTEAVVCVPAANARLAPRIEQVLAERRVAVRRVPAPQDMLAGTPAASWIAAPLAPLDPARLIGREPRPVNRALIASLVRGRRVVITGAGGSIGAELARICATHEPGELILIDRSDNALFEIERQVASILPRARRHAVLHDVVDADATLRRFVSLQPEVVLHAAAHKHVPLMEDHPAAAVSNNLFGTKSVADAALATGAERMVMISTDKAVNPTSVMGATKRLAEHYVRMLNGRGPTRFALVRFGNVLGSACSVIPVWERQLAEGGPITVTHRDMTRFFMTIPEAAALVLQAAATVDLADAASPDVFVLDMGVPVRVLDLARRFLELRGRVPVMAGERSADPGSEIDGRAAEITFTGVRPGEKLYEELTYAAEELHPTAVRGAPAWSGPRPDKKAVLEMIAELSGLRSCQEAAPVVEALRRHVPEMGPRPPVEVVPGLGFGMPRGRSEAA